jgi:large subunit ribosomal protein L9
MQVILLEKVGRLGGIGDEVVVKDGYARNFLLPRSKALRATQDNRRYFAEERAKIEANNQQLKAGAQSQLSKVNGTKVVLLRQASEDGRLYGSVTARDIEKLLADAGVSVDKSHIVIDSVIKTLGIYEIPVKLHAEVEAKIKLLVTNIEGQQFPEDESAEPAKDQAE